MADYQLKINTLSLGETYLERYADLLKNSNQLIIEKVNKEDIIVDSILFDKEMLPNKLFDIFENKSNDLTSLKKIKILYIEHGLKNDLTEIQIF